jgi:hypothetical protein
MSRMDETTDAHPVRASDAEREETAALVRTAADEGRLTIAELDERLGAVYAVRMRHELAPLVADLPSPPAPAGSLPTGSVRVALAVHLVLVVAFAATLVTRWAAGGFGFPWPLFPIFWALVTLVVHARLRGFGPGRFVR